MNTLRNGRLISIVTLAMVLLGSSMTTSCFRCSRHRSPAERNTNILNINNTNNVKIDNRTINILIENYQYLTGVYNISKGEKLQDAIYRYNPNLKEIENNTGLGGAKLIGEMSADALGIVKSRPDKDVDLPVGSLHDLKIEEPKNPNNVVYHIIKNNITINVEPIITCENELHETVNWFTTYIGFYVGINLTNITDDGVNVAIEKGQLIEAETEDVQNIVVIDDINVLVPSQSTVKTGVRCWCASPHRGTPKGSRARLTPFVLQAPSNTLKNQTSIWKYISDIKIDPKPLSSSAISSRTSSKTVSNVPSYTSETVSEQPSKRPTSRRKGRNKGKYTLTFYAWGQGRDLGDHESQYGHAFVDIPTIGVVGYGGRVTDHRDLVAYATYKCSVKINEEQLKRVVDKYYEWKNNPPPYVPTRTDCTTFTLDIADAAGIEYGPRIIIQYPSFFLKQLLKHNPQ